MANLHFQMLEVHLGRREHERYIRLHLHFLSSLHGVSWAGVGGGACAPGHTSMPGVSCYLLLGGFFPLLYENNVDFHILFSKLSVELNKN
jgi:hypothetical protein